MLDGHNISQSLTQRVVILIKKKNKRKEKPCFTDLICDQFYFSGSLMIRCMDFSLTSSLDWKIYQLDAHFI